MGFVHHFHPGHVLCCGGELELNALLRNTYIHIFDDDPGFPSEIVTGALVPLETRKSSIVGNSVSSFWEYESTREWFPSFIWFFNLPWTDPLVVVIHITKYNQKDFSWSFSSLFLVYRRARHICK